MKLSDWARPLPPGSFSVAPSWSTGLGPGPHGPEDLRRQAQRRAQGWTEVGVVTEVGSGPKLRRVVEHL